MPNKPKKVMFDPIKILENNDSNFEEMIPSEESSLKGSPSVKIQTQIDKVYVKEVVKVDNLQLPVAAPNSLMARLGLSPN